MTETEIDAILRTVHSVLVVDWPTKDLPETLFRAGYAVFVKAGPEPDAFVAYETGDDGRIRRRPTGGPDQIDLVHVFRPIEDLHAFVALATDLDATILWFLSGRRDDGTRDPVGCWLSADDSAEARRMVESAGLVYIDRPAIVDAVRAAGMVRAPAAEG